MHPQLFLLYIDVGHTTYSFRKISDLPLEIGGISDHSPLSHDPGEVTRLRSHVFTIIDKDCSGSMTLDELEVSRQGKFELLKIGALKMARPIREPI